MYMSNCNRQIVWTTRFYIPSLKDWKYFHVCATFCFIAPISYLKDKKGSICKHLPEVYSVNWYRMLLACRRSTALLYITMFEHWFFNPRNTKICSCCNICTK